MKGLARIAREISAVLQTAMGSTGATVRLIAICLTVTAMVLVSLIVMHSMGWTAEDMVSIIDGFRVRSAASRFIDNPAMI